MTRRDQGTQLVRRVVKRLERTYRPMQVYLFGSYAYGRPRRDSDLDMLIIKQTTQPFFRRSFAVRRHVFPLLRGQPFDPIVMTPEELQRRLAKGDQFVQEMVTKGKLVYGRR